jgi:DNA-binding IclR family transcriptional regulator
MPNTDSTLRVINRVCDILNCYSVDETNFTIAEISQKIGLPKSTTYRFVQALTSQGLLENLDGHKFSLGHQLIRWGFISQASINLRNLALPVLTSLMETTGETSILSMRFGTAGIWIEMVESRQQVRLAMRIGERLNLHAGASSKILWAFLPSDQIDDILSKIDLVPLEKNTITDPEKMREELAVIRKHGYATSVEETDKDSMGIAAPIYDHSGMPVAGIGIIAPIIRVPIERIPEIAEHVVKAGWEVSARLGAPQLAHDNNY